MCQTFRCLNIRRERMRLAREAEALAGCCDRNGQRDRAADMRRMAGWWRGPLGGAKPEAISEARQ